MRKRLMASYSSDYHSRLSCCVCFAAKLVQDQYQLEFTEDWIPYWQ